MPEFAVQFGDDEVAAAYRAVAPHVEWLAMAAEDYTFERRYSAVVAAEAFHWLDWYKVMARTSESLVRGGRLILVDRSLAEPLPWDRELRELIRESSTNRDYVPYDTAIELEVRGLITVEGRAQTETMAYRQPIEDYVESFHSRNGFSRARLQTRRAQEFDDKLKALLGQYCGGDILCLPVQACIVWGRPIAS